MRIVANKRLMDRNRQITTNLFLVTFVVLIGGFFFVNISLFTGERAPDDPLLLLAQALVLPVAFIFTLFSIRMTNLWARRPYPEDVIGDNIKGLSNKSVLYHYFHIPARHVLICPQGVFTITTRWHNGKFDAKEDHWRSKAGMMSRLFSTMRMDGIGNPSLDAERHAAHVQKIVDKVAPGVTVRPLILLVDPNVQVSVEKSKIPVLFNDPKRDNVTSYLRELNKQSGDSKKGAMPLTEHQIAEFEKASGIDLSKIKVTQTA